MPPFNTAKHVAPGVRSVVGRSPTPPRPTLLRSGYPVVALDAHHGSARSFTQSDRPPVAAFAPNADVDDFGR